MGWLDVRREANPTAFRGTICSCITSNPPTIYPLHALLTVSRNFQQDTQSVFTSTKVIQNLNLQWKPTFSPYSVTSHSCSAQIDSHKLRTNNNDLLVFTSKHFMLQQNASFLHILDSVVSSFDLQHHLRLQYILPNTSICWSSIWNQQLHHSHIDQKTMEEAVISSRTTSLVS